MRQLFMLLFLLPICLVAKNDYESKIYVSESGNLSFRYLITEKFEKNNTSQLLLFLHVAGERGDDNQKQLVHGASHFQEASSKYNTFIIFPQCPKQLYRSNLTVDCFRLPFRFQFDYSQSPTPAIKNLLTKRESKLEGYRWEEWVHSRYYTESLKGLQRLSQFAVPGTLSQSASMKIKNLYGFYGAMENVVLPSYSTEIYIALKNAGAQPRYNI